MAFNLGAQELVILGVVGGALLGWWVRPGTMMTIQNIALTVAALAPLAPRPGPKPPAKSSAVERAAPAECRRPNDEWRKNPRQALRSSFGLRHSDFP
jgi:hypothetical protein